METETTVHNQSLACNEATVLKHEESNSTNQI